MKNEITTLKSGLSVIHILRYEDFSPSDYLALLLPDEINRVESFGHVNRQREYTATRLLRNELFGQTPITYDELGAPHIENECYISISHCKGLVGIAVNNHHKIGLDLESPRSNILDLAPKFIGEDEKGSFDELNARDMTRMWSAKEALYKLAGRKRIIFKTQLLLEKVSNDQFNGRIVNPDHDLLVKLDIFDLDNTTVSINSEAIVRV